MRTPGESDFGPSANRTCGGAPWRRALVAVGFAFVTLCGLAGAATAQGNTSSNLKTNLSSKRPGTLLMQWNGAVSTEMADEIKRDFEKWRGRTNRVVLNLNTDGQSVKAVERVIGVLADIKRTHALETAVAPARKCWSMCVYVYAQGDVRHGSLASTWQFREVAFTDTRTNKTVFSTADTDRLVQQYLEPAGISKAWLADLKSKRTNAIFWQSGADLVQSKSGFITHPLGNNIPRKVVPAGRRS